VQRDDILTHQFDDGSLSAPFKLLCNISSKI